VARGNLDQTSSPPEPRRRIPGFSSKILLGKRRLRTLVSDAFASNRKFNLSVRRAGSPLALASDEVTCSLVAEISNRGLREFLVHGLGGVSAAGRPSER
jgi:hypothetical protein